MRGWREFLPVGLVFATLACYSWVFGGIDGPKLFPAIVWVWLFTLEALVFFPQREEREAELAARDRTWKRLSRDPMTYSVFVFLVLLAFPFFNGVQPTGKPPVPFAPFCADAVHHRGVFLWFLPTLTAALAARHALVGRGKRLLVEMIAWNGAALALFGFLQQWTDAQGPWWIPLKEGTRFFSTFGYPNMAGSFFMLLFAVSCGLWQGRVADSLAAGRREDARALAAARRVPRWIRAHYMLVPALLNLFAALDTLSRAAIMLSAAIGAFWFLYAFLSAFTRHGGAIRIRTVVCELAALGALAFAVCTFAPPELRQELSKTSEFEVADRLSGRGSYQPRVAWELFKDHPLFGVGGWGYAHFCTSKMAPGERVYARYAGSANVHNDYLQFLCEHGAVGALLLLVVVCQLLGPVLDGWRGAARRARFSRRASRLPRPRAVYALPAPTLGVLLGCAAVAVHAFGDCPLRSPAVLCTALVLLACADGHFRFDEEEED